MIEFCGVDVVIQDRLDDDRVRRALATALGTSENRIALIDDVGDYPRTGGAEVVCTSSAVEGEYSRLLSLDANRLVLPYGAVLELLQRMCDLLGTPCLSPDDDDVNPYAMWLLRPGAEPRKVGLDPVAQDEGRYVVCTALSSLDPAVRS